MLSRHFLRSKVLQAVYASKIDNINVIVTEKNFKHTIQRLNDLGTLQLSALVHFAEIAGVMMDEAEHKFLATEADRNPNRRFQQNIFIQRLADNYDVRRHAEESKINFNSVEFDEAFRQAYVELAKLPEYAQYLKTEQTFDIDQQFALNAFKFLMNFESFNSIIFPQSLYWEDDFYQIAQYNYMMLKALDDTLDEATVVPLVHDTRFDKDMEAYNFAHQLLLVTMRCYGEVEAMIRKHLKGWEFERVATMDVLLLNMAVAELTEFPSIPERVTVDECIELSKEFSTDRSKLFINGILDKFIIELRSSGRIRKSGRGLLDPNMLNEDFNPNM
ncbi:MAG: transcription antitermination protein NusB [Bacteroidales bacterium]|nr:transcription antitermination protein NusB [Bacteroidales bacterium]